MIAGILVLNETHAAIPQAIHDIESLLPVA